MKHKSLLSIPVLLAALVSCSLDEPMLDDGLLKGDSHKVQIGGEISQQPATKVTTDGFCTGDEVGIYVVNYDGDTPGTLLEKKNQADNVRYKYDESGKWVSDYDVYYKDNDTRVDIYGYYPYVNSISSVDAYPLEIARDQTASTENGEISSYESSDFLWSKAENITPTESRVIMTFRHVMSSARIRFSQGTGWEDASEFAAVSKSVLITNTVRKTTVNLADGAVTIDGDAPLTGTIPMNDNGEFRAIVAPQTVEAGKDVLVITVDGIPYHYSREEVTQYLPGKITTYDLSINKKTETGEYEVELTGVNITAWEADNVSHGDDAREYVVVYNAVAGRLETTVCTRLEMDPTKIKNLKVTGYINADDYYFMRDKMTSLQRVNLKEVESLIDGVYKIPESAFYEKKTLIKCFLPDKLERIEVDAFTYTSLTGSVLLPEGLKYVNGFARTKITNVEFPSTLEEIGCNTYNEGAFSYCQSLMSVISFPKSIKKIDNYAFCGSAISGNLVFPEKLEYVGRGAFSECYSLTGSLIIPSKITKIEDASFWGCGFTGTLSLPDGLVEIGSRAFYNTKFKGELNIPDGVTTIGDGAFSCTLFNGTLTLPSELLFLGSYVFSGCWRLSGVVTIPSNIVSIPSGLFFECHGLEGVVLHKDVEVVESNAFAICYGITSIVCNAKNPPTIDDSSFSGVAKDNFTVEVPEASVTQYRNATNWSEFKRFSAHREFSISRDLYRSLNAARTRTFVLRAPAGENWSVESKPDWVEVSPSSGTGKVEVAVTVSELASGAGNRSGEIAFLLDGKDYRSRMSVEQYDYQYGDGDVLTLQTATKGNGVNIVLLGDCFDAKDISEGKYLQAIQDAYGYFFDIEPYLTYKDYFNVYGVFGLSEDSGIGTVNTIREARFGSQYTLNEGVSPDFETTFAAACLAPVNDDVSRTLVIMVENSYDYSGLTYMWGDGSAVAVVPMSTDPAPYDFRGLVHHEAGGHGFGKLADEYIYHNAFIQSCLCSCCNHVAELNHGKSCGFYDNVSLTGSMNDVPWAHLIFDPQYSNTVDVYEGAFFHSRGVYRSEPTSCMHNNIPYYNAISRESIVKRLKKYAGEEYSFGDFKANDKESLTTTSTKSVAVWGEEYLSTGGQGQMPPKYMGDKPVFRKK